MKLNKYDLFIQSLFKNKEQFFSATELIEILSEEFKATRNYARQLIHRAANDSKIIKSSAPFSFVKGQYFYMHPTVGISLNTLVEISKKYRKPLFRLLLLLKINEGIVSMYEARKITATPVTNKEKYKTISLRGRCRKRFCKVL
ncbi:hypothetical protein ACFPRA_20495 [Sporosarcina soli]|uniref:Uncharacterized protein n=1 Tax=Sporosarcina soli TaxID=334736 RepID=A0ABW0TP52_9BACL